MGVLVEEEYEIVKVHFWMPSSSKNESIFPNLSLEQKNFNFFCYRPALPVTSCNLDQIYGFS